jgi:lipopolysaccharide transport system ATP-binding protein
MTAFPVSFESVWKKFRRGERGRASSDFWALQDVSFQVSAGEALGVIGPNGAGKSTTLKLLTRILKPTRGHCAIRGRVGALIEVAAGVHPDLSGRENIFLQGAIMGMPRADITRKLDDIIEFSGLGDFIDTQVKRYSSGMNARLGFSIAANLEPDVLLIDEVLAVGDMVFQQRCVERMEQFRDRGAAIVFVSHDLQAVAGLCQRSIFLKSSLRAQGPTHDVIHAYITSETPPHAPPADAAFSITAASLANRDGQLLREMVPPGARLILRCTLLPTVNMPDPSLKVRLQVSRSTDNLVVDEADLRGESLGIHSILRGRPIEVAVGFSANLRRGHYHVAISVLDTGTDTVLASGGPPVAFVVDEKQTWTGVVNLDVQPTISTAAPLTGQESDK